MLRTRSGEARPVEQQAADDDMAEMGKVVADARLEIARLVQLGELQHDPIRYPIQALGVHLDALYKVASASGKAIGAKAEALGRPIGEDELRRAVAQGINNQMSGLTRAFNWRTALFGAWVLALTLIAGAGAGYAFHGAAPVLVGVKAGAEKCDDRPDGSRLCWIPVFERLPATK